MFECSQEIFTWYMQGKSQITFPLVEEVTEATWGHGDAKSSACGLHVWFQFDWKEMSTVKTIPHGAILVVLYNRQKIIFIFLPQ